MRVLILTAALVISVCAAVTSVAATSHLTGMARVGTKPITNAVVWLEGPTASQAPVSPPPTLDQRNLQFWPDVLVVRVGTTVKFPNNDRVFHNVFWFHDGKKFDLGVYPIGAVKHVTLDARASAVCSATSIRTWRRPSWRSTLPTSPRVMHPVQFRLEVPRAAHV